MGGATLPLAPVGNRFGALIVDGLIAVAIVYVLFNILIVAVVAAAPENLQGEPDPSLSLRTLMGVMVGLTFALMLIQWAFDSFGWSPGKAATGVRVVRLDGRRPGVVHGLVRYSMRTVSYLVIGLGYFWALWDDRNQTWHDKIAGTVVVRAQPLRDHLPDRRPDPLVTHTRIWWLAALGTALLTASIIVNVLIVANIEGDLFDPAWYEEYRLEDDQRIHRPETPDPFDARAIRLPLD